MAADTVGSLFNLPTAQQAGQQYYEGLMSSPAQMNQLGLLQQVVAMGRDGGASLGYGAGRLLGGRTADEVRIQGVNEAMAEATRMGGTDADMYANLAKGLAARGLTQDAMAATEKARAAKRDEQAMTLAASQEARAVSKEGRDVSAEQRAMIAAKQAEDEYKQRMAMYPLDLQVKGLAILKAEQDLNGAMGEITMTQEALNTGINPKTGQPLTNTEAQGLRARLAQATLAVNNEATKIANEKAEHELKMKSYEASIASSKASTSAANARAKQESFTQSLFTDPDVMGQKQYIGKMDKQGRVLGSDGVEYSNRDAAIRGQGIGVEPMAPAAQAPAQAAPQPGFFDRLFGTPAPASKTPQKPLSAY